MKSKMNIKSIIIVCLLCIVSLFFINKSFANNTAKIAVDTANLRSAPSEDGTIVELLSKDQEVEILEKTSNWYKIKFGQLTGYVREDLLIVQNSENVPNTQNTTTNSEQNQTNNETTQNVSNTNSTTDNTNTSKETTYIVLEDTKLKIVPLINSTDIIEVKKDEEVKIIEKINGWVCIETKTSKGWIREDKIGTKQSTEAQANTENQNTENTNTEAQNPETSSQEQNTFQPKTQYIASESVNLRAAANTSSEVLQSLVLNTHVEVIGQENDWSKVRVNGKEGYILTSLLSDTKKETSRGSTVSRQAQTNTTKATTQASTSTPAPAPSANASSVVDYAKQFIGSRYVYGGSSPSGFDCSGFTSYVYKQFGVSLNRTAAGQYSNGVAVSRSELAPGDLVMFGKSGINHVGIYIGGGQIVHAANSSRGVTIDTINSGYYNNNYVGARRVK